MRLLRSVRVFVLAVLVSLIPASSYAGVFISVNFAPPVMPVYVQPPCPEPGWMWQPGYWAYGEEGYYWVPGMWVPAPYVGALWTPGYWGWDNSFYMWHPGYWGRNVGYYGGINYGFGYFGIGFIGGRWHDRDFEYNTAYMHVDDRRIHRVYTDRRDERRYVVARDNRTSFSGGRDGVQHRPTQQEQAFSREQRMGRTQFQVQHEAAARSNQGSYFRNNNGHPMQPAVSRPMQSETRNSVGNREVNRQNAQPRQDNRNAGRAPLNESRRNPQTRPQQQYRPEQQPQYRASPQYRQAPQQDRAQPQYRESPQQYQRRAEPQQQYRAQPQPQYRAQPQQRVQPQQRSAPQQRSEPRPQSRPESRSHEHGK